MPAGLSADEQAAPAAYERMDIVGRSSLYLAGTRRLAAVVGVVGGMATSVTNGGEGSRLGYLAGPVTLDDGDRRSMSPMAISRRRPLNAVTRAVVHAVSDRPIPGTGGTGVLMGEFDDDGPESSCSASPMAGHARSRRCCRSWASGWIMYYQAKASRPSIGQCRRLRQPDQPRSRVLTRSLPAGAAGQWRTSGVVDGAEECRGAGATLAGEMDFAVNRSCEVYAGCSADAPMVTGGKAILRIEYRGTIAAICEIGRRPSRRC